ncbi:MAG: hypothetical protein HC888_11845 [Candidatus Competibacteraceae bacterium]|nr:hypothetical protein [Candidatus Competibacteraceae bacterium]
MPPIFASIVANARHLVLLPCNFLYMVAMAKILLVDDDTELTSVLGEWLESEGYIVESAENGEEALFAPGPL